MYKISSYIVVNIGGDEIILLIKNYKITRELETLL